MTEHDAPTVARATIWLDTSSDTPTRPRDFGPSFDNQKTMALERPPLATPTFSSANAFAAFQNSGTETFERAEVPRPMWLRLAKQSRSSRAIASLFVAALVAAAFAVGQLTASSSRSEVIASPPRIASPPALAASATPKPVAPPAAPTPAEPTPVAQPSSKAPAHASEREAVEALARGDYPRALVFYRALADEHPHDAAFAAIERLLSDRVNAPCASGERKGGPCGG